MWQRIVVTWDTTNGGLRRGTGRMISISMIIICTITMLYYSWKALCLFLCCQQPLCFFGFSLSNCQAIGSTIVSRARCVWYVSGGIPRLSLIQLSVHQEVEFVQYREDANVNTAHLKRDALSKHSLMLLFKLFVFL